MHLYAKAASILLSAVLLLAAPGAWAKTAQQFMEQAYAPWLDPTLKRISDTDLMSTGFMKLWQVDDAAADKAGEVGVIQGNLICACQDGQMSKLQLHVRDINATHATAQVTFAMDGMAREQLMLLKNEQGHWTIDDIVEHGKSLRARLREDARMRQAFSARPARR